MAGSVVGVTEEEHRTAFRAFVGEAEPRLRRAFVAAYGWERGREATAEALAYAWEHWSSVQEMGNALGYLYRVGQSRTRARRRRVLFEAPAHEEPWYEPALAKAVEGLSEQQRTAVVLVYGFGWTMREVGELTGIAVTSVQNHVTRGLAKLRDALEVPDHA